MQELVQRVNWSEYLLILMQGNPPIALQLAVVNVVLVGYWLFSRGRKRKTKHISQQPAWMLQLLFVAGNIGVVTWGGRLSF